MYYFLTSVHLTALIYNIMHRIACRHALIIQNGCIVRASMAGTIEISVVR